MIEKITPEGMRAWLISLGGGVAGNAHRSARCPVANFMKQNLRCDYPIVGVGSIHPGFSETGECHAFEDTPHWLTELIKGIDRLDTKLGGRKITAIEALGVLESVVGIPVPFREFVQKTQDSVVEIGD